MFLNRYFDLHPLPLVMNMSGIHSKCFCGTQRLRNWQFRYSDIPVQPKIATSNRPLAHTFQCYRLSTQFQLHLKDETRDIDCKVICICICYVWVCGCHTTRMSKSGVVAYPYLSRVHTSPSLTNLFNNWVHIFSSNTSIFRT